MKALLTGASGQLGGALKMNVPSGVEVTALGRTQLDLTDADAIRRSIAAERPAVVINAAAYTAVDKAESERDLAFAVNGAAVGAIARACREVGARLVHISTDFVFDGARGVPYRPSDPTAPVNVYGESKLEGERQASHVAGLHWQIVRTAWVYASTGRNFMLTMLRLFRERPVVSVVCDQVGTPTSARTLAACIWRAAQNPGGGPAILHYTDAGVASWYDFAIAVQEEALALGLIAKPVEIRPISTDQYPTPARRPSYSVLDKQATLARLQIEPIHWRTALRQTMQEIVR